MKAILAGSIPVTPPERPARARPRAVLYGCLWGLALPGLLLLYAALVAARWAVARLCGLRPRTRRLAREVARARWQMCGVDLTWTDALLSTARPLTGPAPETRA